MEAGLNLRKLYAKEAVSDLEYIKWLQDIGLLGKGYVCPKCGDDMKLLAKAALSDGYAWRCCKKACKCVRSIRKGTWFSESKLSLRNIVMLTYMWCEQFTQKQVKKELGVADHTVVDWYNFCRELCFEVATTMSEQIGGPGEVVEVDESCFSKRKYNRGRKRVSQQWVFGGIQRGSNKCFLVCVEKRDAKTLVPIIEKYIAPGTTIYSDCWKAYSSLNRRGYRHLTVNHKLTFKDGDVCTNTVEGMWAHAKRLFPVSRKKELISSYLGEFVFRKMCEDDMFKVFVEKVAVIYKPATADVAKEDSSSDSE
ncbi:putative transposase-like protein [Frankliniella fusca]|uniref:Transposase-like protein n=1 Tax=Frankliniella fusca TaxID=407009 RepID=A0AAE1HIF9_9NEOP|nr:putative transposase-like protein [Frankliniella fusca]